MSSPVEPLTTNMRATIGLLIVYVVALVVFGIGTPAEFRVVTAAIIIPALILNLIFIVYGRRRKVWSYVGAMVVGIALMLIQVAIGSQAGSGPPTGVEALFIVLPGLLALKSYESILELRK